MKILSVTPKTNHRGPWWLLKTDQDGARKISTANFLDADIALGARNSGAEVTIRTRGGFYYDELQHIALVKP